ncbi:pepsin/retropepsin-like aspartic protease family protein [Algoriphagus chordae]|uniref:Aspartyl protease n=1 Tax=Algoriphagus chordae TaxID=237019 RepID=A0A2W7QE78_9BACT|nr:pepsin/retropepsin-like aspartic protease family protein [Algoriphagus chordae]PZX46503.1 aspartyl protease [Algoriphagus chordae]
MKNILRIIAVLGILICINSCKTNNENVFKEIYNLIEENNYFEAKKFYESNKSTLSKPYQQYFETILYNAFNRLEESDSYLNALLTGENNIPDSLKFQLYSIRSDNAVKMYNYKKAKNAIQTILSEYKSYLDDEEMSSYENTLKIWAALENTPKQKTDINENSIIKMEKDLVGLSTLKVFTNKDSLNFIFDTGANLSTTTQSVAKRLNMEIIPVEVEVGTITGDKVLGQLAVCEKLSLGNIEITHAIFLVLPDEALSFPQINYKINGILGFPIFEALKEIRITQNNELIVPQVQSTPPGNSNMAMNGLIPLIYINNKHFTFDTGADQTVLYKKYYDENKKDIDEKYKPEKISFGGAGGKKEFEGYTIDYSLIVGEEYIKLENVSLLKEEIKDSETVYGNIGQDLIKKFDVMIINFNQMFIKFERKSNATNNDFK